MVSEIPSAGPSIMLSSKRKIRVLAAFAVLLLSALAVGCRGFFVNPTLTTVTVGPSGADIQVGKTLQMVASGTYDDGSTKTLTGNVLWSSSDTGIATVSDSGLATGVLFGSAVITATSGTVSGSTTLNVSLANIIKIEVTPTTWSMQIGDDKQFTAIATVQGGQQFNITDSAQWTSTNTSIATIDSGGLASGVAAGTVSITATSDNITSNSATLTINSTQ
jgi:uncharacterized protein YjdB